MAQAAPPPRPPDPEQQLEQTKHETEHQAAAQTGADRARSSGIDPRELMSREWLDSVNDLDLDRDLPTDHPRQWNIAQLLGAHGSKQLGIGYITREEYETSILRDRGHRRLLNSNYRRPGGTGSACTGRTRERMTGGEAPALPMMTADLSDQLDAAFDAKKHHRSGSVGGKRFRGSTEVQVVTKSEGDLDFGNDKNGLLSRVTGRMMG